MYKYNICFIRHEDKILLINRKKAPLMGLWNGVGGKIEKGESVIDSVIREVREETGLNISTVMDKGVVTWYDDDIPTGGMHVFIATLPEDFSYPTPAQVDEGILDWKDITWITDPNNSGIVPHVPLYINKLFHDPHNYEHQCTYKNGKLVAYEALGLVNSTSI